MAPRGLNTDIISDDLKSHFPEIRELFNVHLWTITADMLVFSAHVLLNEAQENSADQDTLIERINRYLSEQYQVIESTIQMTSGQAAEVCE
jgi:Co/Zn/Cd efflux system component